MKRYPVTHNLAGRKHTLALRVQADVLVGRKQAVSSKQIGLIGMRNLLSGA